MFFPVSHVNSPVVSSMSGACSEFASSFAELSAVKEKLEIDREALSAAEASLNADKLRLEKQAATAQHRMQRAIAKEVSCTDVNVLDAAAAVVSVNIPASALHAGAQAYICSA